MPRFLAASTKASVKLVEADGFHRLGTLLRTTITIAAILLLAWPLPPAAQEGGRDGAAQERAALVRVDPVRYEEVARTAPLLGRVVAVREGEVAARVGGSVAEVAVAPGDRVAAGDALVRLDPVRLDLEVQAAKADRGLAEAERDAAEREVALLRQELDRLERLRRSAAFSAAQLDDKRRQIDVAESRVAAAEARLRRAEIAVAQAEADLEDAVVRAPYPGVVVQRLTSPGAYVAAGQPVVRFVDDADVEIEADVPAELVANLSDAEVGLRFANGDRAGATLRAVIPVESPLTRTQAARFRPIDDAEPRAIGGSVTLNLPAIGTQQALTVAKDAVNMGSGTPGVFVVGEGGRVAPRRVRLGASLPGRFVVEEGLAEGEAVVVRGNERLRPGQKVETNEPAAASAAGSGA